MNGVVRFLIDDTEVHDHHGTPYLALRREKSSIKGIVADGGTRWTRLSLSVFRPWTVSRGLGLVMDLLDEILDPNSEKRRGLNEMTCTCQGTNSKRQISNVYSHIVRSAGISAPFDIFVCWECALAFHNGEVEYTTHQREVHAQEQ
jgi:hypothetical protein